MLVGTGSGLLLAGAVVSLVFVWLVWPRRSDATPRWLTLILLLIMFGSVVPTSVALTVQVLVIVGSYAAWLLQRADDRRGAAVVIWVTVIGLLWFLFMFHPNIPGLDVGLLGLRKTVFCLFGLVLGVAVPRPLLDAVEMSVVKVLALAVGASIALHVFAPQWEQTIVVRSADMYTSSIDGIQRLQGVFAGPFHVAIAALLLVVWGVVRIREHRIGAPLAIGLGGVAVYLTAVRTAYVALLVAICAIILTSRTLGRVVRRLAALLLLGVIVFAVIDAVAPGVSQMVDSIAGFSTDRRFLGRFDGYREGFGLFLSSPVIGWGAGSAGDTLGVFFAGGEHVTSHNVLLKILVEGGLLGGLAWLGLAIAVVRNLRRGDPRTEIAVGAVGVVLGMGITGSSLEALPPTYVAFMFVGLALRRTAEGAAGASASEGAHGRLEPTRGGEILAQRLGSLEPRRGYRSRGAHD